MDVRMNGNSLQALDSGAYFPVGEKSFYTSPLTEILRELRRRHVVAAAATAGLMSYTSQGISGRDLWKLSVVESLDEFASGDLCSCHLPATRISWMGVPGPLGRRRLLILGGSGFGRGDGSSGAARGKPSIDATNPNTLSTAAKMCPTCGKKKPFDPIGAVASSLPPDRVQSKNVLDNTTKLIVDGPPEHAQSLLQSTPHLRHLTPAATDMHGNHNSSRNILSIVFPSSSQPKQQDASESSSADSMAEYRAWLLRDRVNKQAASELASFLSVLAHEMSLEDYGDVENEVFTAVFALVHTTTPSAKERRLAGVAALNALIDAPSADEEKKAIKFANILSNSLRLAHGDYEFLSAVSKALGHMSTRTGNVDFVESEVTRALEWLNTERSDRRLAASLALKEFAIHAPTAFYSKTSQITIGHGGSNEFLDHIFKAIRDPQPIVRACAADAMSQCLKILVERQRRSLVGLLCQVHFALMEGFQDDQTKKKKSPQEISRIEAAQHGSLLVVACMIAYTRDFMLPRYEEVCRVVLGFVNHPKVLIRLEVVRLIPRLARRRPDVFGRRYLEASLLFLIRSASGPGPVPGRNGIDIRPSAFSAIGALVLAMTDPETGEVIGGEPVPTVKIQDDPDAPPDSLLVVELTKTGIIYEKMEELFGLVRRGLKYSSPGASARSTNDIRSTSLHCAAHLVEALGEKAHPFINDLINDMFEAGLSEDLIHCLHTIAVCVPEQQNAIEDRLLQGVSQCLAGISSAKDICDPLGVFLTSATDARRSGLSLGRKEDETRTDIIYSPSKRNAPPKAINNADVATESRRITVNMSDDPDVVGDLVLSLRTLGSFGDEKGRVTTSRAVVPLLPFVRYVAAEYLSHPTSDVRRASALTCCILLIPYGQAPRRTCGVYSGLVIEEVLGMLLQTAVSDTSPEVRLCVVRALDTRYDSFLCQTHHLQPLFLLLHDEELALRAAGLELLGRLGAYNPAPILPIMRRFLTDLTVELSCGLDTGRSREEATRLLVVCLRAKSLQRLVHPILPSIVEALPLSGVAPRLASAALEALGELAQATRTSMKPWVKDVIPYVLEAMQDQSSASKQRTSLRTLGQLAGSTGYVILPYLDYPQLLSQAIDVLPGTKRAPWALRREVIRTLGILGALDPDRYHTVAPKTRKGGAVGGAYFEELDQAEPSRDPPLNLQARESSVGMYSSIRDVSNMHVDSVYKEPVGSYVPQISGRRRSMGSLSEVPKRAIDADDSPAHLFMYEQYAMIAQPVSSLPPARRMTPADDEFYPTVSIQALMRIFKDPSLAVHHGMVMQAIMFIFKSLGLNCVPYLGKVVPHMIHMIRICGPSQLRESLFKQLATLGGIVREHLRPYATDIFDVAEMFWSSRHIGTILNLLSKIAVGVPDEFRRFVPRLVQRLLASLEEMKVTEWASTSSNVGGAAKSELEKLELILRTTRSLRGVLPDYVHVLVPALLSLLGSLLAGSTGANSSALNDMAILTLQTISILIECKGSPINSRSATWNDGRPTSFGINYGLPARVVQPLVRMLNDDSTFIPSVGFAIVETLVVCAMQLGGTTWTSLLHKEVRNAVCNWQARVGRRESTTIDVAGLPPSTTRPLAALQMYDEWIRELQSPPSKRPNAGTGSSNSNPIYRRQDSMIGEIHQHSNVIGDNLPTYGPFDGSLDPYERDDGTLAPFHHTLIQQTSTQKVNQANLQRAWDVTQRSSREDWDEWMRRLAIQLLREAPSPALRATASLAQAYQPLARELFSAAFVCCWRELSDPYRANLVHALETAFSADVSPEILQTLLNLAEFMEHDSVESGLPIEISILAELALKCRAYAKALHYKEREHNIAGSGSCVGALISINKKLDLPEAALGVLKAATAKLEPGDLGVTYAGQEQRHIAAHFLRHHHAHEMLYSVITSTDDSVIGNYPVDLAEHEESWLVKLGSWADALQVYERRLFENPRDFDAVLGCMKCLDATGEWKQVLEISEKSWVALTGDSDTVQESAATVAEPRMQAKALKLCAQAAWRLKQWDDLEKFSSQLVGANSPVSATATTATMSAGATNSVAPRVDFDGAFFSAVLHIHRKEWALAARAIDVGRKAMDSRFTALMAESYSRAYPSMVTAQNLAEMEEIIEYRKLEDRAKAGADNHPANRPNETEARQRLLSVWRERLAGCRVDADVHSSILVVRSLVLNPLDEVEATLGLSDLSRQAQRFKLAERVLLDPLIELRADLNGPVFGFGLPESLGLGVKPHLGSGNSANILGRLVAGDVGPFRPNYGSLHEQISKQLLQNAGGLERLTIQHRLYFAYVKHLFATDRRDEAMHRLKRLSEVVDMVSHCELVQDNSLRVSCWLALGEWRVAESSSPSTFIPEPLQLDVLTAFKRATALENCGYKAWHAWSLFNFRLAEQHAEGEDGPNAASDRNKRSPAANLLRSHVVAAAKGFVTSISLGTKKWSASVSEDLLNLLSCLFKYGELTEVARTINEGIGKVAVEAWLGVLPQLLARIHIRNPSVRSVLHPLLTRLGEKHPQALMYPLSVLLKSPVVERKSAAESLMNSLKAHSSALVEEALMVSSELIRVAILWLETWHEGLEDASRLYFGEANVTGMLELLLPLHENLEKGAETGREGEFIKSFGQDLAQAHLYIKDYMRLVSPANAPAGTAEFDPAVRLARHSEEAETIMNKIWDIYYTVFRRINKQLPGLTKLELSQCSPALSRAQGLELGVPGTYRVDGSYIKIEKFISNVQVITSKQRPRKITIRGSDGKDYVFLLKGHEDLRQDERVMQLFGLVNALLALDRQTRKHDLSIQRYAIAPLSHNCGVVGWVPHCDTLHSLIRDYRQAKKIPLNMENREMLKIAPDYDLLTVMQKVEVFTDALKRSTGKGNDLYEILWLKSTNSEEWLERRTKYIRSLAVSSMIGYVAGIGDRHPSNLMIDKLSGGVLHIDFGDCFEVAMNRDKYPEKVPFRLTRMLVKAMEVSGIEGSYRSTCERTMTVLRNSRDSLVAMLEAFVYDPLISWRLAGLSSGSERAATMPEQHNGGNILTQERRPIEESVAAQSGVPIDLAGRTSVLHESISEAHNEDEEDDDHVPRAAGTFPTPLSFREAIGGSQSRQGRRDVTVSASRARSLQMYSKIQALAANVNSESRIASITGERSEQIAVEGSMARSRIERSMRQREVMSLLQGEDGAAHEEALNEKALKVIRRVREKLTGTDFPDYHASKEPLDVPDQVQRLIVEATSCENLCQLFIGWCAFW